MKKYIPYIVIILITYLAFSFVNVDFNPKNWVEDRRLALIFTSLLASIVYLMKQKENEK